MNKEILYGNSKIVYRVYGEGIPVLLIHGFGEDGTVWKNQVDYFKENFFLIVPDLPGSGQSENIPDMSMEGLAEVIHSIIHEENISRVIMIGHSMGGYITLAFAEKYRNHLYAFGLFHSTAFADNEEKIAARKKGIEFIEQHGAFEFLKTSTPNLFSSVFKTKSPQLVDEFIASFDYFSPDSLINYYKAMMQRPDRTSVLKTYGFPVLFIMGEHDIAIPLQDVLKQSHLPKQSFIHILRESGHMGMIEESTKANLILEEFLLFLKPR